MEDLASRIAFFGHTILLPLLRCLQKVLGHGDLAPSCSILSPI